MQKGGFGGFGRSSNPVPTPKALAPVVSYLKAILPFLPTSTMSLSLTALYFVVISLIHLKYSTGDFSALMTYASLTRAFAFGIIFLGVVPPALRNNSRVVPPHVELMSLKTMLLYSIVFLSRLSSILRHEGYLPYDKSGDWIYHALECVCVFFAVGSTAALYKLKGGRFNDASEYSEDRDTMFNAGGASKLMNLLLPTLYIAGPAFVLSCLIHPSLNSDLLSDVSWTFSMYLESFAIVPQLYLFQKFASSGGTKNAIPLLKAHILTSLSVARLQDLVFWLYSYKELTSAAGSRAPGIVALVSQLVHLAIMADFLYYYVVAISRGGGDTAGVILPTTGDAV